MVRFKNRWLLVEFIPTSSSASILSIPDTNPNLDSDGKQIFAALKKSVLSHYGTLDGYYSPVTNICIIGVGREHHKIAWGAVTMLSDIDRVKCIPHVIHVSGTIKQVQLAAIAHNREVIARHRAQANAPVAYRDSYDAYLNSSVQDIEGLQD
ncbi:hypothetical protein BDP27DRAFT_1381302 [Rhodocollybia butyracea]|uniref:Uncharacterized protein n=1 Tax=Rhodocollybia butyracea TaxID=206335 RepID=A0A9P5Q4D3_9AGAR|nr:hypothetical protein BDP27DRAFT_1381302 [Rhodocollybia butyracea]